MQILSMTSEPWQEVLDRLPPDLDLDTLAVSSGALKHRREVGDGATLLRLAMARGPGGLSLNQTATWAAMQGVARPSPARYALATATSPTPGRCTASSPKVITRRTSWCGPAGKPLPCRTATALPST